MNLTALKTLSNGASRPMPANFLGPGDVSSVNVSPPQFIVFADNVRELAIRQTINGQIFRFFRFLD